MNTKEKLAALLEEMEDGEYISGSAIAETLGITRAAIWKNIKQLQQEGYSIEAVTNKGYRLAADNDAVSAAAVNKFLGKGAERFNTAVFGELPSTNTYLKEKAPLLPDWSVAVAGAQSAGRGRTGRSFYSPAGSGVYLSILLRPDIPVTDSGRLTTAAAVAACRAIERCTDAKPQIKWVNDVFVNGKKVCGILTEASVNFETGSPDWIVTGIGFNVYEPEDGFPEEIADVAGAIARERKKNLRSELAAAFMESFFDICRNLYGAELHSEYRERCFMLGKQIYVLRGEKSIPATAMDINKDFALKVRYADGSEEVLNAGEVSTKPV